MREDAEPLEQLLEGTHRLSLDTKQSDGEALRPTSFPRIFHRSLSEPCPHEARFAGTGRAHQHHPQDLVLSVVGEEAEGGEAGGEGGVGVMVLLVELSGEAGEGTVCSPCGEVGTEEGEEL